VKAAREVIASCLADVEDCPEPEHYSIADDVLLALNNAGLVVMPRVQIPSAQVRRD